MREQHADADQHGERAKSDFSHGSALRSSGSQERRRSRSAAEL